MQYLLDKINEFGLWLFSFVTWGLEQCWSLLCQGLGLVLAAIPVPAWLANAGNVVGAMPPGVAYLAQAFMIPQGIAMIVGAYTLRFVVRRLPLIG
jgi:hypothetical protein